MVLLVGGSRPHEWPALAPAYSGGPCDPEGSVDDPGSSAELGSAPTILSGGARGHRANLNHSPSSREWVALGEEVDILTPSDHLVSVSLASCSPRLCCLYVLMVIPTGNLQDLD